MQRGEQSLPNSVLLIRLQLPVCNLKLATLFGSYTVHLRDFWIAGAERRRKHSIGSHASTNIYLLENMVKH